MKNPSMKRPLNLYTLLLLSIFFDAYAFVYIEFYPVTMFTLLSALFLIQKLICLDFEKIKVTCQNLIAFLFAVYLILNFIFYGFKNLTSFLQAFYFIVLSMLSYRNENRGSFENYCNLFQRIMNYMSVYAIYQFVGRLYGLPLTDLMIKNHMVSGYNWSNAILILGQTVYRSNAIFREPSYFAQMLAVSLLLYLPCFLTKQKSNKKILPSVVLQVTALITTFSGTGVLTFMIGFAIFASRMLKNKRFWIRIVPIFFASVLIGIYVLFATSFGDYFLNRLNELFVYNKDASAGFVRFRVWTMVVKESWDINLLLGSGIGTGTAYVAKYMVRYFGMTLNGFAKVATELGLLGIVIWCSYILSFFAKKKNIDLSPQYLLICCSLIPMIFMHEAFSSNIFWTFVMIINCRLCATNAENDV